MVCTDVTGRAQELCESRGGRLGLPVPNSPRGLRGRQATLNLKETGLCFSKSLNLSARAV